MATPNVLTASLPEVPVDRLADGVLKHLRPVRFAERIARYRSEGTLKADISMAVGWVYPDFSGEGNFQAYAGGPIIPAAAEFSGEGFAGAHDIAIPRVFASFEGNGTASARATLGKKWFSDSFERPNGPLASPWYSPVSGAMPVINGGAVQAAAASGTQIHPASFNEPMTTDDMVAMATIKSPAPNAQSEIYVRAPQFGTTYRPGGGVACAIWSTAVRITTINSTGESGTERATASGLTLVDGDVVELRATGSTYRVLVNGVEKCYWADPGGVVVTGPDRRYCGLTAIYGNNNHAARFDNFACGDL